MATLPGYDALIYKSPDGAAWTQLTTATDIKPGGQKNDMLDRTYYGQGDAQKRRSKGLHDNSVSFKLDYDSAAAQITGLITDSDAGNDVWLKVLYDGVHGFSQKGLVENYDVSPPINGKVEVTFTWLPNGVKTVI
jgi:hypothetical protein